MEDKVDWSVLDQMEPIDLVPHIPRKAPEVRHDEVVAYAGLKWFDSRRYREEVSRRSSSRKVKLAMLSMPALARQQRRHVQGASPREQARLPSHSTHLHFHFCGGRVNRPSSPHRNSSAQCLSRGCVMLRASSNESGSSTAEPPQWEEPDRARGSSVKRLHFRYIHSPSLNHLRSCN